MEEKTKGCRKEIELEAAVDNISKALDFIEEQLNENGCENKTLMQILVASEEIFSNIAFYAYAPETGRARIIIEILPDTNEAAITFIDQGIPYDPLKKEDPDIMLPSSERQIGGLGIFMVKKTMDDVIYEYKDGCNILTIRKRL